MKTNNVKVETKVNHTLIHGKFRCEICNIINNKINKLDVSLNSFDSYSMEIVKNELYSNYICDDCYKKYTANQIVTILRTKEIMKE